MNEEIKKIKELFALDIAKANTPLALEELRVKYLGRKSYLANLFSKIPSLTLDEKTFFGKELNVVKQEFNSAIENKLNKSQDNQEELDLTFPAVLPDKGSIHVISSLIEEICACFKRLGFLIIESDEVEDEWHNFTALNFPQNHPSRDEFDTFYLNLPADKNSGRWLLRCHTSPTQARILKNNKPPLAIISPGRVYRPDEVDATHSFMFHQIEGFAVTKDLNFANLKGVLTYFAQEIFSKDIKLRFRPHYFPFTEPSAEVDMSCIICGGQNSKKLEEDKKCSVCKGKGWLEILGCGMIHPNVLKFCGIDSKKYRGFAFGMGVERIAMLKYGINDIRLFTDNDVRFLKQF